MSPPLEPQLLRHRDGEIDRLPPLIGCDDVGELAFFPGMDMLAADKIGIVSEVLDILEEHFEPVTIREHIDTLSPPFRRLELKASRG